MCSLDIQHVSWQAVTSLSFKFLSKNDTDMAHSFSFKNGIGTLLGMIWINLLQICFFF